MSEKPLATETIIPGAGVASWRVRDGHAFIEHEGNTCSLTIESDGLGIVTRGPDGIYTSVTIPRRVIERVLGMARDCAIKPLVSSVRRCDVEKGPCACGAWH